MSNLRRWFTGAIVINELKITLLDLAELVEQGKLTAHHPETRERVRLAKQVTWREPEIINTWDAYEDDFAGPPLKRIPGGFTFVRAEPTVSFKQLEGCGFLKDEVDKLKQESSEVSKKTRKTQEIWEQVRSRAKELWDDEPTLTKEEVASHHSITQIFTENGKEVGLTTIMKHIKDLNPNRNQGRRPKKK